MLANPAQLGTDLPAWDAAWEPFLLWLGAVLSLDLYAYKPHQIRRRLLLYAEAAGYDNPLLYQAYLEQNPEALKRLTGRLTISTTAFFRDRELWQEFKQDWLERLLHRSAKPIRIWSAACATGQEVYSLAVLLAERRALDRVQLIGSDWSERALQQARSGIYRPEELEGHWDRLRPYLQAVGNHWQFQPELRDCIEWRRQDLFSSSFPKSCDWILCRNLLIYLHEGAQRRLVQRLLSGLKPDGRLWLGKSERLSGWKALGLNGLARHLYSPSLLSSSQLGV
ncbi:protein-glutamate O-methyltransferase CheR [Leptolyngbya sp. FACHB-261]|uniref:CheR family methyltransferase n=1 Tax=Leptolyngbya sp. FACHB-261 TaxID=2692806 RepID=UPI001689AB17|nr:protein-glutamate O-methyltransferase CheR [Leptolyngbya sp. FACHB-261]MBD2104363.1 protein-glutamate O-methyltransferase CheR [Leptolyngbya sp. FACHB-261]